MKRGNRYLRPFASILAVLAFLAMTALPASGEAPGDTPWVGLGAGRMGDVLWAVKVAPPSGSQARAGQPHAHRPCLLVGTKWELGRYDYRRSNYQRCFAASARLSPTEAPLIVSGAQASGGMQVKLTAVGMVFAPAARRVQVTLDDGSETTIPLRRLSPSEERKAGVGRFRYAAFAVRGSWSVARIVARSASGRALWDSGVVQPTS
jgi:hypothetical protein